MNAIEKRSDRADVHVGMTAAIEREADFQRVGFRSDPEKSPAAHPTTLNEIQIRACRIHREHGAVYGGYTLDDWLAAEHELDDEFRGSHEKAEQVQ